MNLQLPIAADLERFQPSPPAYKGLEHIDWDFPGRTRQSGLEAIHPYPAKFIPEIPAALLDCLPLKAGTAVLDPFVGSGTTLAECQRRGIPSVGVDLNPIACLISRVKTARTPKFIEESLERVLITARRTQHTEIPRIPNLDHWFASPVQQGVSRLVTAIEGSPIDVQDVLRLGLSSILVRVSNQESDTRYAAIQKNVQTEQVYETFCASVRKIEAALKARKDTSTPAQVLERDTLKLEPKDINYPIGAIVTSPPYPNAYEYWLYHKYRMWWLGYDPISVKAKEIGARAHFFKNNGHTADDFHRQMTKTFEMFTQVLIPGGYACFVIGRSKIHGAIVDNANTIEEVGHSFGFKNCYRTDRIIAPNRKTFNLSHAGIKKETILVLEK